MSAKPQITPMIESITINGIDVKLIRKKVKRLCLKISRDAKAELVIPTFCSEASAKAFLEAKSDWLINNLKKQKDGIKDGGCFNLRKGYELRLLGRTLPIYTLSANKNEVRIQDDEVICLLKQPSNETLIDKELEKVVKAKAFEIFSSLIDGYMPVFAQYGICKPGLAVKRINSVWGNCSKQKNLITFRLLLIALEPRLIEYVVLHELTHLIYFNHQKPFYDFIKALMPDYKEREKELKHFGRFGW